MRQRLSLFVLTGAFWLLFFTLCRAIFLVYHRDLATNLTVSDFFMIFLLGSRMDAAIAADCIILTGLLLTLSVFKNFRWIAVAHHIIVAAFLVVATVIVVSDLELYTHWAFRMDSTPLMYLRSEGMQSVQPSILTVLLLLAFILMSVFYFAYLRYLAPRFKTLPETKPASAAAMFFATALLFIPIRSSFSVAPLNTGVVYFHKTSSFANHAGINVVWNFFESVADNKERLYPDHFYDPATSERLLRSANNSDSISRILNQQKPNVIFILLESFTAQVIEPLGGISGVTPELNQLCKEGLLFDQFYSSGDRTDKGIVAILSGYPAQPRSSIIKYPSKTQSLPFLPKVLKEQGYSTSFVYGGDIGFANMESYVTMAQFDHVTEDDDFESDLVQSKWGVHDEHVFRRLMNETDTTSAPFFKVILTLSSHEPFDVPITTPGTLSTDESSLFVNACRYTDKCLGDFIREAKTKSWWNNTLIVITADHGHRYPDAEELKNKNRFKVPMLWTGGAINKDSVIHSVGSHTDMANMLLGQISRPDPRFAFSKNLLAPDVVPYAVFVFHNGFGYLDAESESIYDFDYGDYLHKDGPEKNLELGKAYMQMLFTDYNSR